MSISVTVNRKPYRSAGTKLAHVDATLDISSYTQGGEDIAAGDFDLRKLTNIEGLGAESGYVWEWDDNNGKIKIYEAGADGAALDEATAGVSPGTFKVTAVGI